MLINSQHMVCMSIYESRGTEQSASTMKTCLATEGLLHFLNNSMRWSLLRRGHLWRRVGVCCCPNRNCIGSLHILSRGSLLGIGWRSHWISCISIAVLTADDLTGIDQRCKTYTGAITSVTYQVYQRMRAQTCVSPAVLVECCFGWSGLHSELCPGGSPPSSNLSWLQIQCIGGTPAALQRSP